MKKGSVFAKTALGFIAFYVAYTTIFTTYRFVEAFNQRTRVVMVNQSLFTKLGRILLKQDKIAELDEALGVGVEEDQIHFYVIRKDGKNLIYGNKLAETDHVAIPEGASDGILSTDRYRFTISHEGPYELIIGHEDTLAMALRRFWIDNQNLIAKDLLFVLIGMFSLVLYTFRDLRSLVKKFALRGVRRGDVSIARSHETLTLVRGVGGYEAKVEALHKENLKFRSQVLPALRRELESGRKPPYEFDCTLVRTDINDFTSVFSSDRRQHFMESINEFFMGVTHIVSRYGGSVYEFIGDEVLFYFKDEDCENSAAIAVSALRDIHRLALELSDRTETEGGYRIRVKSSVAWGTLRFGPLVDGFSLAGSTLIETVRMLSHVHEKSENTVLFDRTIAERVQFLARTESHQLVMLKGLSGSRYLHRLEAFTPLSFHLRQMNDESLHNVTYYRQDDDIAEILSFTESHLDQLDDTKLNRMIGTFRDYKLVNANLNLRRRYLELLKKLIHRAGTAAKDDAQYLLATLISNATQLFTEKEWNTELRETFLQCLNLANRRVVANTLDVFAELEPSAADLVFDELAGRTDNRIVANALVKEGKSAWTKHTAKKLEDMLKQVSPYFRASGLYALGEIAQYQKETDEAAFAADARLQKLLDQLKSFAFHANAMVRRQALKAAWKSERLDEIQNELNRGGTKYMQDVVNEVRMYINEQRDVPVQTRVSRRTNAA